MYFIKYFTHSSLTEELLDLIIIVKSVAWRFSYDSQRSWITENIKNDDVHVLLFEDDVPLAYMNLVKIDIQLDSKSNSGYGIGNVCAVQKGKGWGKVLLLSVNDYLKCNNHIGLLFCKEALVKYYSNSNWILIENEKLNMKNISEDVKCMMYSENFFFKTLKFSGKLF